MTSARSARLLLLVAVSAIAACSTGPADPAAPIVDTDSLATTNRNTGGNAREETTAADEAVELDSRGPVLRRNPIPFADRIQRHDAEVVRVITPPSLGSDGVVVLTVTGADDRGVAAVEITLDDVTERVPADGSRMVRVDARRVVPRVAPNGMPRTSATFTVRIVSVDGHMGQPSHVVIGTNPGPTYHPIYGPVNFPDGTNGIPPYLPVPWWNVWLQEKGGKHYDWKSACGITGGVDIDGKVLACWLDNTPWVRDQIIWVDVADDGTTTVVPWSKWTLGQKASLAVSFYYAYQWIQGGAVSKPYPAPGAYVGPPATLFDPPTNMLTLDPWDPDETLLEPSDAFTLYLTTVAHSLALEIGGFIPWSITGYSKTDLRVLFDVRNFYSFIGQQIEAWCANTKCVEDEGVIVKGYEVMAADTMPTSPQFNFGFLLKNDMIGSDHSHTIGALTDWDHLNMLHYGTFSPVEQVNDLAGTNFDFWQYLGASPASRVFGETTWVDPVTTMPDPTKHAAWVYGCWGSTSANEEMLRAANIPAGRIYIPGTGHATSWFDTIDRTLSHGDDLYGGFPSQPPYSGSDMLISSATFDAWFNAPNESAATQLENVDRQQWVVALNFLSNELLSRYCDDVANNRTHANGLVLEFFHDPTENRDFYSQSQLEAKNLWQKLKDKTTMLNYCANYPPPVPI